ncbi:MAG: flagellar biosynthesis anti-sigma factor FlgM [Desulfovibrio sp.]|nr:flagellar biosynthesis anti-sigma factor FlgM [Desulfovibrio sp.]
MEIRNAGMSYPLLDPYANSTATTGAEKSEGAAASRARPAEDGAGGGDTISVSRDALLLTEARRTAQNAPDVRAERVAELRAQVANGTYNIDAQAIAESLVREEPSLFRIV